MRFVLSLFSRALSFRVRSCVASVLTLMLALTLSACGDDSSSIQTGTTKGENATSKASYVLSSDLKDAKDIFSVADLKEGDSVALHGRVRQITKGFASFVLTDDELEWCGRDSGEDCGCKTPWDYCCLEADIVNEASITVEVRDEAGDVVESEDHGLRPLDWIAVKGTLAKNESGGLFLITKNGWYKRERPEIRGDVDWASVR